MPKPHSDKNGRFFNPWSMRKKHPYMGLIKWLIFSRNKFRDEKKRKVEFPLERPDFDALEKTGRDYIVWLGHSTVFIKSGSLKILTDPVFWDVNIFVKRKTPFPIDPREIPKTDYVIISHSHLDHLNTKTIKFLKETSDPFIITGPGYERYFKSLGISKHITLDWREEFRTQGVRFISLPIQHWSKRTLFDTNKMLWCSYLIEHEGFRIYWIGDTGYFKGFSEVGEKYGPVDLLLVPVGAYEPRWFMAQNHVNPEEALMIARDVKASTIIPIHWGTFDLTDEPLWLPIEHLKEIYDEGKDAPLKILRHGESIVF